MIGAAMSLSRMAMRPQSDVPVLVETPSRPTFRMVRCHYLSIESDDPRPGWNLGLERLSMPFLMLHLVGIVQQPLGAARFNSYGLIDGLFTLVEEQASLSLNFEDIWLPDVLFHRQVTVGDVYRVGERLFTAAYQYRDGRYSQEMFEGLTKELLRDIVFSEDETQAFKSWSAEQLSIARNQAPKNRDLQLGKKREA